MATPIGHVLAGYAVSRLASVPATQSTPPIHPDGPTRRIWRILVEPWPITALCVFMAIAPDLDLIPGLLQGKPILYHGGITHSLGGGVLLSLGVAGVGSYFGWPFRRVLVLGFVAYASHLLLDPLGPDGRVPYGIPILWPLSDARFLFPTPLLPGVRHAGTADATLAEFVRGVLSVHNITAIASEVLLLAPWIGLGLWRTHSKLITGEADSCRR